ncbi:MAG: hypothetical protein HN348_07310 [Proteobacteria bacterium]|jgi:hypothetical protein|nr:hypothetical protein [Pseudomonadota bacterium]
MTYSRIALRLLPVLLLVMVGSACMKVRPGVLYPSNQPLFQPYETQPVVQRQSCATYFLGFTVNKGHTLRQMVDKIKGDGDAVVDLTIDYSVKSYGIVDVICYLVVGTPVEITSSPPTLATSSPTPRKATSSPIAPEKMDGIRRVASLNPTIRHAISAPSGAPQKCLIEVWTDSSGKPLQIEPDPNHCKDTIGQTVVSSVLSWRFEQVVIEGKSVAVHFPLQVELE